MPLTPDDPAKAQVWVHGSGTDADPYSFDFYIPRGSKGEPGGFTTATIANEMDLNTLTTPGLYRVFGTNAAVLNYPSATASQQGMVEVITSGTLTVQVFYPNNTAAGTSRLQYTRYYNAGWTAWAVYGSQRVDQSAGRAIYTWDDVNRREQLIYGDTGWRKMTPDPAAVTTDNGIYLRRNGPLVTLRVVDVTFTAAASSTSLFAMPDGFRPADYVQHFLGNLSGVLDPPLIHTRVTPSYDATPYAFYVMRNSRQALPAGTRVGGTSVQWITQDAWPTALPGASSSPIPNV